MTYLRVLIQTTFDITDEGVCTWIIGMGADYTDAGSITLHHSKYIDDMLDQFNMTDSNHFLLPWSQGRNLPFMKPPLISNMMFLTIVWSAVSYGHRYAHAMTSQMLFHVSAAMSSTPSYVIGQ
jgi:hypothetical protein